MNPCDLPVRVPLYQDRQLWVAGAQAVGDIAEATEGDAAAFGEVLPGSGARQGHEEVVEWQDVPLAVPGDGTDGVGVGGGVAHNTEAYTGPCKSGKHYSESHVMSTSGVSDERLIRLNNLRRLCNERNWDAGDLHKLLPYGRYTYWRDLLKTDKKPFGEKAARRAEAGLGLPDKWLDTPRDAAESRVVTATKVPAREPTNTSSTSLVDLTPSAHWREVADLFADEFSERGTKMLPITFLLLVDAGVEMLGEDANKRQVQVVLDKLMRLMQHGDFRAQD